MTNDVKDLVGREFRTDSPSSYGMEGGRVVAVIEAPIYLVQAVDFVTGERFEFQVVHAAQMSEWEFGSEVTTTADEALSSAIRAWIEENDSPTFSLRDLQRRFRNVKKQSGFTEALTILEFCGVVTQLPADAPGPHGGRPKGGSFEVLKRSKT